MKRKREGRGYLITADMSRHIIQRLNNPQPQLLPLLALLDSNVLDMADQTERVDELALDNQAPRADDAVRAIADDQQEVLVCARADPVIAAVPLVLGDVADGGQHAQHLEVAAVVVGAAQGANGVVRWDGGNDFGGDQGGGEKRRVVGWDGGGFLDDGVFGGSWEGGGGGGCEDGIGHVGGGGIN